MRNRWIGSITSSQSHLVENQLQKKKITFILEEISISNVWNIKD